MLLKTLHRNSAIGSGASLSVETLQGSIGDPELRPSRSSLVQETVTAGNNAKLGVAGKGAKVKSVAGLISSEGENS